MDLQAIGRKALTDNKHLKEVFVTADGVAFIDRNSAINYAVALDDKTVLRVETKTEVKTEVKTKAKTKGVE